MPEGGRSNFRGRARSGRGGERRSVERSPRMASARQADATGE